MSYFGIRLTRLDKPSRGGYLSRMENNTEPQSETRNLDVRRTPEELELFLLSLEEAGVELNTW